MSVATGREVILLRYESFLPVTSLRDFSILFEVLTDEWQDAYVASLSNEERKDLATLKGIRRAQTRRRKEPDSDYPLPPIIPARVHYGSPLDILIENSQVIYVAGSVAGGVFLNRFLDGIVRISAFPNEIREARARQEMQAVDASRELFEAEQRASEVMGNEVPSRWRRVVKEDALDEEAAKFTRRRRKRVSQTGLAVTGIYITPEDELPED